MTDRVFAVNNNGLDVIWNRRILHGRRGNCWDGRRCGQSAHRVVSGKGLTAARIEGYVHPYQNPAAARGEEC